MREEKWDYQERDDSETRRRERDRERIKESEQHLMKSDTPMVKGELAVMLS